MLATVLFLVLLVVVSQLHSRLKELEQRVATAELRSGSAWTGFSSAVDGPLAAPAPVRAPPTPAPAAPPSPPPVAAGEEQRAKLASLIGPPAPAESSSSPQRPVPGRGHHARADERSGVGFGFEELFGRRLPIWAGGVTLAVAGVLIVRYSIEAGLLSPLIRFLSGLMFGAGLIAAAEAALRIEDRIREPRVRQALAGAGIATLYASLLVATNLYGLIGPVAGFVGMAAVTGLAMLLSLRFGAPSALLGLVGGLAAPALVGTGEPNVPLLSLYLALAVGGLSILSRAQRWAWLGVSALIGGLGWGAVLLLGGVLDVAASLSIGFYLFAIGIAFPLIALPGARGKIVRIGGALAAAAQMAALVAAGGFTLLHWGLFGLISIAIVWLSGREQAYERLPVVGLAIALLLLGAWPNAGVGDFALVLAGAAALYGLPALLRLWHPRGSLVEAAQIAVIGLAGPLLPALHFYRADHSADLPLAGAALGSALLPALGAMLGWRQAARREDGRFALLVSAAALLLALSAAFAAPSSLLAPLVAAIALLLLLISLRAQDARLEASAWVFAIAALPLLGAASAAEEEVARLFGHAEDLASFGSFLRWSALAAASALFARFSRPKVGRSAAQAFAALLAYGAAAQILPEWLLPIAAAGGLVVLAVASSIRLGKALLPCMAMLFGLSCLWALLPLLVWADALLASLGGDPVFVSDLPLVGESARRLLLPAALILGAATVAKAAIKGRARAAFLASAGTLGTAALHIFYKQLFALAAFDAFVRFGMAERTLWEALLLAAGLAAWRFGAVRAALCLVGLALAHFGLYTLLLHNPLWADQSVGSVPILNWLLPAYGLPLAALWFFGRHAPDLAARYDWPRTLLQMLLIALLSYSLLRQAAAGSILSVAGLSPAEDIARSILTVALAIGFLLWGIAKGGRDWRIASLALMLAAAAKVFLLDASGLEGLMRIGSFVALGISLIGIGWLYSRHLGVTTEPAGPLAAKE